MGSAKDVMSWCDSQIGNSYGGDYWPYVSGSPFNGQPWCAAFVSAGLAINNVTCPYFPSAVAFDERDNLGDRKVPAQNMIYGDVVGYSWRKNRHGDHVGFFLKRIDDYSFYAIEGNTDDGVVALKQRYYSEVTCGVRPYYSDSPDPHYSDNLVIDGWAGTKTILKLQRELGMGVCDGVLSSQLESENRYRPNVWAVNMWNYDMPNYGSATVHQLQIMLGEGYLFSPTERYYLGTIDGLWGIETSKAIQRIMSEWGYYSYDWIDGVFGPTSVKALQQSLNDNKW